MLYGFQERGIRVVSHNNLNARQSINEETRGKTVLPSLRRSKLRQAKEAHHLRLIPKHACRCIARHDHLETTPEPERHSIYMASEVMDANTPQRKQTDDGPIEGVIPQA